MMNLKKLSIIALVLITNISIISASTAIMTTSDAFKVALSSKRLPTYPEIDLSDWELVNPIITTTSYPNLVRVSTDARFIPTDNSDAWLQQNTHDMHTATQATKEAVSNTWDGAKNTGYFGYQAVKNSAKFVYNATRTTWNTGASIVYGLATMRHFGARTFKRCGFYK